MRALAELFPTRFGGYWGTEPGTADVDALAVRNGDIGTSGALRIAGLPCRGFTTRQLAKARLHAGDLLLTTSGNCGNVAFVEDEPPEDVVATNFVRVLRANTALVDNHYAYHYLRSQSFRDALAPFIRGATIQNLAVEEAFGAISLHLPAIEEQRRVAAILDHVASLCAKRQRVLAGWAALKSANFGHVPGGPFEAVPLSKIADVKGGKRLPKGAAYAPAPTSHPYIRVSDLKGGSISESHLCYLTPDIQRTISRYTVAEDDVVITIAGSIGLTAAVPASLDGANLTENAAKIVAKDRDVVLGPWLASALRTPDVQAQITGKVGRVTIGKLALFRIEQLMIPLPPIALQREYLRRDAMIVSQMDLAQQAIRDQDELVVSLQSRAFAGDL